MKEHGFLERRDEELIRKASGPETSEKAKKRNRILKWIGIAACVCLLVGGAVWAVLLGSNRKDDPALVAKNSMEATQAPTEAPTQAVTDEATQAATQEPTQPATQEVTQAPTEAVTDEPTEAVTDEPTEEPTQEPTEVPTEIAKERPTYTAEEIAALVNTPGSNKVKVSEMRTNSVSADYDKNKKSYTPAVAPYTVDADLGNVTNKKYFELTKEQIKLLSENGFFVELDDYDDFYQKYETNRYRQTPSFITVDSIMHTYHLYYVKLQKSIERTHLYDAVCRLTDGMLTKSLQQYFLLQGSEWEEAARLNVVYFGVAAELLGLEVKVPAEIDAMILVEVDKVMEASGMQECLVMPENQIGEDYTQYIPRSYYAGNAKLERYFRTMMWYGRINFAQKYERANRSALLMNIALSAEENYKEWYSIYEITSFLTGASDDIVYNEYMPVIKQAYGVDFTLDSLVGNASAWEQYTKGITKLHGPKINSLPVSTTEEGYTTWQNSVKGYRFMGQRFVLDAEIFQNLLFDTIEESEELGTRDLPDALDIPAAFGSDTALDLLKQAGHDKYPNYLEKMQEMRQVVENSNLYWTSSVYGGWLYTLKPLTEEKGAGYPFFMTNLEWRKKSLESFLGSWTELKHDTALYAKQAYSISESGGFDAYIEPRDDRGYVEPEPELFDRLGVLARATENGLNDFGYLSSDDKEALELLAQMCDTLRDISVKELEGRTLTDEEYDWIRAYGSSLEHFWDLSKDDAAQLSDESIEEAEAEFEWYKGWCKQVGEECEYANWEEYLIGMGASFYNDEDTDYMALVSDVATDVDDELCLEEAIGGASSIYVVFPIDGELHIGVGAVYTQYQFTQPMSERMTDRDWKKKSHLNYESGENGQFVVVQQVDQPEWMNSYRTK